MTVGRVRQSLGAVVARVVAGRLVVGGLFGGATWVGTGVTVAGVGAGRGIVFVVALGGVFGAGIGSSVLCRGAGSVVLGPVVSGWADVVTVVEVRDGGGAEVDFDDVDRQPPTIRMFRART